MVKETTAPMFHKCMSFQKSWLFQNGGN